MFQAYCAYHTVVVLVLITAIQLVEVLVPSIHLISSMNLFFDESRVFGGIVAVYVGLPIFIHWISMIMNAGMRNDKWVLIVFFFLYFGSLVYYFKEYRKQDGI